MKEIENTKKCMTWDLIFFVCVLFFSSLFKHVFHYFSEWDHLTPEHLFCSLARGQIFCLLVYKYFLPTPTLLFAKG